MAIETNKYIEYDTDRHEYSVTAEYLVDTLPITQVELEKKLGDIKKQMPRFTQAVYRLIYRTNVDKKSIQYKIYLNLENERQAILDAIIEYVLGAYWSGMDLNSYMNNTNKDMPDTVKEILDSHNLLYQGSFSPNDIEDYGDY